MPLEKERSTLKVLLDPTERAIIYEALREHGGSRQAVAAALGINRTTLYNKMCLHELFEVDESSPPLAVQYPPQGTGPSSPAGNRLEPAFPGNGSNGGSALAERNEDGTAGPVAPMPFSGPALLRTLQGATAEFERMLYEEALRRTAGDVPRAARLADLAEAEFSASLGRYRIDPAQIPAAPRSHPLYPIVRGSVDAFCERPAFTPPRDSPPGAG